MIKPGFDWFLQQSGGQANVKGGFVVPYLPNRFQSRVERRMDLGLKCDLKLYLVELVLKVPQSIESAFANAIERASLPKAYPH